MTKKILLLLSVTFLITFSCSKDEDKGGPLSKQDSQEVLNNLDEQINETFAIMENTESDGLTVLSSFAAHMNESSFMNEGFKSKTIKSKLGKINVPEKLQSIYSVVEESDEMYGTYTWNASISDWDFSPTPTDAIIFNFPTVETTPRDASIVVSNITMKTIVDEEWGFEDSYPTGVKVSIKVDETEVGSVNLSASWSDEGEPTALNLSVNVSPAAMSLIFGDSGSKFTLKASMTMGEENLMAADLNVGYTMGTDEYGDETMEPTLITGSMQYATVKIMGDVDVTGIMNAMNTTEGIDPTGDIQAQYMSLINENINLALYTADGDNKIADLEVAMTDQGLTDEIGLGGFDILLVYSDGSKESLMTYATIMMAAMDENLSEMGINLDELFAMTDF